VPRLAIVSHHPWRPACLLDNNLLLSDSDFVFKTPIHYLAGSFRKAGKFAARGAAQENGKPNTIDNYLRLQ
jgi:hypothetical protein